MNITELEKLAKAVYSPTKDNWEMRHAFAAFNKEANPQTILSMIALLREMGEALKKYQKRGSMDDLEDADYAMDAALAKYKGMTK
jgi:hypothetical protein